MKALLGLIHRRLSKPHRLVQRTGKYRLLEPLHVCPMDSGHRR